MIVRLKPEANILMTEAAIRFFRERDCEVHVKRERNGAITIAAFEINGSRININEIDRIAGVEYWESSNRLFVEINGNGFVEAWEFLQKK
jgi:hypothetical protein